MKLKDCFSSLKEYKGIYTFGMDCEVNNISSKKQLSDNPETKKRCPICDTDSLLGSLWRISEAVSFDFHGQLLPVLADGCSLDDRHGRKERKLQGRVESWE